MHHRRASRIGLAGVLGVTLLIAACSTGGAPSPSATPAATSSPTPVVTPVPSSAPVAQAIDLDVAPGHHVSVVVDDPDNLLVGATTGHAGDGMSVRWGDASVTNVDPRTLRVTWVGLPGDEQLALAVGRADEAVTLAFEQAAPPAYSDATGFDRVLVLEFAEPVSANAVTVSFSAAA